MGERTTGTGIALWIVGMSILGIFAATLAVGKSRESAKGTQKPEASDFPEKDSDVKRDEVYRCRESSSCLERSARFRSNI